VRRRLILGAALPAPGGAGTRFHLSRCCKEHERTVARIPVLATCGIRPPELPCENPSCCLLLLADSPEDEYNRKHASAHLYQGGMDTVQRILTFVTCLTRLCLRSLHHCFVTWTKPDTTSLLLGTLTDLSRSKSELVAENALLRQQLIILRRQVKRPACTKTDRLLLVLLARKVRSWKQALIIVQPETPSLSSRRRSSAGIAKDSSSTGNTSPEQHLPNQRYP